MAFIAFDTSPDSIVKRLTRRDKTDGDVVGLMIDSFHDLRTAFIFGVSAGGVKYDGILINNGLNEDFTWDPNWWVKTSVNNEGWIAEMKIPLSQLRFKRNSGEIWGLQAGRNFYRESETDYWQHIPKGEPGVVHLIGELSGLEQAKPRKIFDLTPYGVASMETFNPEPDNPFLSDGKKYNLNAGLDAKIGVTNNMTMDLTVNPDFGQVEADPSVVNLTAYETFFEEKRPFFIEGSNITSFGFGFGEGNEEDDNLFYSRRIGHRPEKRTDTEEGTFEDVPSSTTIIGAAKLTGKTSEGLSVGFLEAVTARETAEIDNDGERSSETVEPLTNYFVGRMQKDFKKGNTILGGIITGTNRDLDSITVDFLHKSAYSGGIDFTQYFRDKNWMFTFNAAMSHVKGSKEALEITQNSSARYFSRIDNNYAVFDPHRTSLTGAQGRMQLFKLNGHFNILGAFSWKTPGFEINDLGYMQYADQLLSVLWAGYNQWEPKGIYRNYSLNGNFWSSWNFGGNNTSKGFDFRAEMTFRNYWNIGFGGNVGLSSLSASILRGGPLMKTPGSIQGRFEVSSDDRKDLEFDFHTNLTAGFENDLLSSHSEIKITYKPFDRLNLTVNPEYTKSFSELQYVTSLEYNNTDRYIFASIDRETISASLRISFSLSPDLTFEYWGQPFIASGKYYDYKFISDPLADIYLSRFKTYTYEQIGYSSDYYDIDEDIDGTADYGFERKDFSIQEFLSNLVLRWEYSPGSTLYLVWSQTRNGSGSSGYLDYLNDLGDLFDDKLNVPHNVFLLKFSYRFGLR